ncbi:sensor domain-containing protein [Mycobacterium sp. Marseille-P9652]|uniref:sensor domain-containing protein n=1 Tax=Mycobacterium sp. Marseille-P9652 TaxID=2654950 RepID=UPI0012E76A62|nr:sensor domain-containing protein [Mycobacterium sp. Marseille-P9652]
MSSHPNTPAPGGRSLPNPVAPQGYPHGARVDPWAQTWVRPVGVPVVRPPAAPGFPAAAHPPTAPRPAIAGWPPHGYPPMGPPPRGTRRRWALIGGVTAVVALVTAGTGVFIAVADRSTGPAGTTSVSEPPSAPPPAPTSAATPPSVVPIDALPGLLLDPAVVNGIEGTTAMVVRPDPNAGSGSGFADLPSNRPECKGVQHPAMVSALQGSGWIAAQTQVLSEPNDDWKHLVSNAVVDFPSAQLATDYAARQAEAWGRCAGKPLTTNAAGEGPVTWSVGPTSDRNGVVSVVLTQEGAVGWGCQRALTARNNIVVDARSCGFNRTDQAVTVATKIAERVHAPNP